MVKSRFYVMCYFYHSKNNGRKRLWRNWGFYCIILVYCMLMVKTLNNYLYRSYPPKHKNLTSIIYIMGLIIYDKMAARTIEHNIQNTREVLFKNKNKKEVSTKQIKLNKQNPVSWMNLSHMPIPEEPLLVTWQDEMRWLVIAIHSPLLPLELGWGGVVSQREIRCCYQKNGGSLQDRQMQTILQPCPFLLLLYLSLITWGSLELPPHPTPPHPAPSIF